MIRFPVLLTVWVMLLAAPFAQAQAPAPAPAPVPAGAAAISPPPGTDASAAATPAAGAEPAALPVDGPFSGSFMFNQADLAEVARAKAGILLPSAGAGSNGGIQIPAVRRIIVSGVYYKNPSEWIVWINNHKVTPGNLIPEIMDIKVVNDRVRLKWFDIGLNGIITLEMRPHQVYDIVTGVMLPG